MFGFDQKCVELLLLVKVKGKDYTCGNQCIT